MLLADLGATVLRLDRTCRVISASLFAPRFDLFMRGRSSVAVDLKHPAGVEFALKLSDAADASIEGFRPGTMERLGLGPDVALARNLRPRWRRLFVLAPEQQETAPRRLLGSAIETSKCYRPALCPPMLTAS